MCAVAVTNITMVCVALLLLHRELGAIKHMMMARLHRRHPQGFRIDKAHLQYKQQHNKALPYAEIASCCRAVEKRHNLGKPSLNGVILQRLAKGVNEWVC